MTSRTKIVFSADELDRMNDSSFLLSKRLISDKIIEQFSKLSEELLTAAKQLNDPYLDSISAISGKISKGENYKGLPYIVLDCPRHFKDSDVLAFRTMFWWGNFFSCTLHLAGQCLDHYRSALEESYSKLMDIEGLYVSVGNSAWQYHYEPDNYQSFHQACPNEQIWQNHLKGRSFIKLSKKLSIGEYKTLPSQAISTFDSLMACMKN